MDLKAIQTELRARSLGGWLFYDHHHRDAIAYRILGLPADLMVTRRWFYLIPAKGEPSKLVHRIESGHLDALPGRRAVYSTWQELDAGLRTLLAASTGARLALQYSPLGAIPAISLVDAGMAERLRALGTELTSSADLVSRFDALWDDEMLAAHRAAGRVIDAAIAEAFKEIRRRLQAGKRFTEYDLQQWLVERMLAGGIAPDDAPIVAVNEHSGNPHYSPSPADASAIVEGDLVLLDVWGKLHHPRAAYYDVTWMGCCTPVGHTIPVRFAEAFGIARAARDSAIALVEQSCAAGRVVRGYEVDRAARAVIAAAGLGEFFVHRTGHSIALEIHASGANMDDYETHDEREILPGSCFSIEPGIYRPEFGVRTEVNMFIAAPDAGNAAAARAEVTGPRQREIVRI